MGQRANLILIEGGRHTVYYAHWRANTLPRDLFWGPVNAATFIRAQRLIEEGGLLDQIWAEGGAVLDCDHKVLLLFGGDDLSYDVPLRRAYLRLMDVVWQGWEGRWAHEGAVDVAEYIGRPRDDVLSASASADVTEPDLSPPEERGWVNTVGSVRFPDGRLKLFPMEMSDGHEVLLAGPTLIDVAAKAPGVERLYSAEWTNDFPGAGFHIDVLRRTVEFWTARDAPHATARVARKWPEWSVTWHRDRYEAHLAAAGPALRFPQIDEDALFSRLRELLLIEDARSGAESLLHVVQSLQSRGEGDIQINEYALRDAQLSLSQEYRIKLVDSAIDAARSRQ
jgi:hypothetical protein